MKNRQRLNNTIKNVGAAAKGIAASPTAKKYTNDFLLILRMLKDYASGEYKYLSGSTVVSIALTALYIVSPIDIIPDHLPVIGGIDDAIVLTVLLKMLSEELKMYKAWLTVETSKEEENVQNSQ